MHFALHTRIVSVCEHWRKPSCQRRKTYRTVSFSHPQRKRESNNLSNSHSLTNTNNAANAACGGLVAKWIGRLSLGSLFYAASVSNFLTARKIRRDRRGLVCDLLVIFKQFLDVFSWKFRWITVRLEKNRIIGKSDGWSVVRSVQFVCVCAQGKGHDFRDWSGQLEV